VGEAFPHLFRDGSRKLGLNDHLCAHAWAIEDFNSCLDIARTWNEDLQTRWGIAPLEENGSDGVIAVCKSVMADLDRGRLVRTHKQRAIAITDGDELGRLVAKYDAGDSALALLMKFRVEHTARCRRGETFYICIKAMVEEESMGRWAARKYRAARDILLKEGLIELVVPASGTRPAEYRLAERLLTPSLAECTRQAEAA
jgi:hypothetical protein